MHIDVAGRNTAGPLDVPAIGSATDARAGSDARATEWDADIAALEGNLLQSWRWGEFKAAYGWDVERVRVECAGRVGLAQVLFRSYGPFSLAYMPRGPVVPDDTETTIALLEAVDATCTRRRAITLMIEPDRPLPLSGESRSLGFVRGPNPFQPSRTVKVPLLDDAALLAQMRRDTRANVRRAERDGVVIERAAPCPDTAARFYALIEETAARNSFAVHSLNYYVDLLRVFGDDALVSFARVCDEDAVVLIAVRHGPEAAYLYGGSSQRHRVRGAAALLQVDAMRWAREGGVAGMTCGASPPRTRRPRTGAGAGGAHPRRSLGRALPVQDGVRRRHREVPARA